MNAKQVWQTALESYRVPSNFATEWLEKRYSKLISETLNDVLGHKVEVKFEVRMPVRGEAEHVVSTLDGVTRAATRGPPVIVGVGALLEEELQPRRTVRPVWG